MSKKICFALISAVLFVLPSVALAQGPWGTALDWSTVGPWIRIFFGPNIPDAFMANPYSALQWLIFPFISLWLIIYGILSQIRIFRTKTWINGALAFLIAVMAAPSGGLVLVVKGLFTLYGGYAFLIFIVLLFAGTGLWGLATFNLWGIGRVGKWEDAGKRMKQIIKREDKIDRLQRIARDMSMPKKAREEAADELMNLLKEQRREMEG